MASSTTLLCVSQIEEGPVVIADVGSGCTVIVTSSVFLQPAAVVSSKIYVVVTIGLTPGIGFELIDENPAGILLHK